MMKKIIFSILVVQTICSCDDVLMENPKSMSVENFYQTQAEIDAAVAAIYAPLQNGTLVFGAVYIAMQEASADYYFTSRGSYLPFRSFDGLDGTNRTRSDAAWQQFYLSIRNANLLIANVNKNEALPEQAKNTYIAEGRAMRALCYFHMVRNWGALILRTEENMTVSDLPKSSIDEVYGLVTADLLFAEQHLPETAAVPGRITRWASKTMLADVYFYLERYSEAAAKAYEVIQADVYDLVEVSVPDDFHKLFGPEVVTSPEEIFAFKYSQEMAWQYPRYAHAPGTPYLAQTGYIAYCSTLNYPYYLNWDDNDLRKEFNWYLWNFGEGTNTLLNKKFSDPVSIPTRNDYPLYRYADLLLLYAEASCEAENAPTSAGLEALNRVHRRAYGHPSRATSPVDFQIGDFSKISFVELVRKERGYETQGEGKRWLDLKRTGQPGVYLSAASGRQITVTQKALLWPIPDSELSYNKALDPTSDQNPGY